MRKEGGLFGRIFRRKELTPYEAGKSPMDNNQLQLLYNKYLPKLTSIALGQLREKRQAEEAASFALEQAWIHRAEIENPASLEKWLMTTLDRRCNEIASKLSFWEVPINNSQLASEFNTEKEVDTQLSRLHLLEAMNKLSPKQRQIYEMADLQGLDYSVIAKILKIPIGTVSSELSRARLKMKELLRRIR